jgi:outer membrane protein assembly factor BamB
VVANGRIYAAGADNKLYAFDAIKGTAVPGFPRTIGPALTFQSPVFANGNIYVASQGAGIGKLYAFNGATGAPIAGFPKAVGDGPHGPMAATGNNIYVSGSAGKIFGFNALTGATLAGFPIAVPGTPNIFGGVTAVNGKLLFGADDHNLYSYNAATGAFIGSATLGGAFNYSTPSASGGTVYAAPTNANHLSNFTEGANLLWDSPFISLGNQGGAPAIAYGRVFLSDGSGKAYAFDTATGALKWSTVLGAAAEGSVLVANGVAYASTAFKLFALDAATGAILWSHQNYAKYGQSPVVANGMVYAASGVGGLRAFSINGLAPAAPEAGGELGVRPSLSRLKPDISLKPQAQ